MGASSRYTIRRAKHGDEQAIHDVHMYSIMNVCIHEHGKEEVSGWGQRPFDEKKWRNSIDQHWVWVVEDVQLKTIKGMGHLMLSPDNQKYAYVAGLYFHPDIIGRGLGRQMLDTMISVCNEHEVTTLKLESSLTALEFYKTIGFKETGPLVKEEIGGSMVSGIPMQLKIQI